MTIKNWLVDRGPFWILRGMVVIMGLIILALCLFALPSAWRGGSAEFPAASTSVLLIIAGLYATSIPFFISLFYTLQWINLVDNNEAFSPLSVETLKKIKYAWAIISILYLGGWPLLYPIAQADDAPGLIIIGLIIALIPVTITAFVSLLEKLFGEATNLKK